MILPWYSEFHWIFSLSEKKLQLLLFFMMLCGDRGWWCTKAREVCRRRILKYTFFYYLYYFLHICISIDCPCWSNQNFHTHFFRNVGLGQERDRFTWHILYVNETSYRCCLLNFYVRCLWGLRLWSKIVYNNNSEIREKTSNSAGDKNDVLYLAYIYFSTRSNSKQF